MIVYHTRNKKYTQHFLGKHHQAANHDVTAKNLAKAVETERAFMKARAAAETTWSSLAALQKPWRDQFETDIQEHCAKETDNRLQLTPTANERREFRRKTERDGKFSRLSWRTLA